MTIIEKVARALVNSADLSHVNWEEQDWPEFIEQANAAIEAMRFLVKCDRDGCQTDDIMLNEYIDRALNNRRKEA